MVCEIISNLLCEKQRIIYLVKGFKGYVHGSVLECVLPAGHWINGRITRITKWGSVAVLLYSRLVQIYPALSRGGYRIYERGGHYILNAAGGSA